MFFVGTFLGPSSFVLSAPRGARSDVRQASSLAFDFPKQEATNDGIEEDEEQHLSEGRKRSLTLLSWFPFKTFDFDFDEQSDLNALGSKGSKRSKSCGGKGGTTSKGCKGSKTTKGLKSSKGCSTKGKGCSKKKRAKSSKGCSKGKGCSKSKGSKGCSGKGLCGRGIDGSTTNEAQEISSPPSAIPSESPSVSPIAFSGSSLEGASPVDASSTKSKSKSKSKGKAMSSKGSDLSPKDLTAEEASSVPSIVPSAMPVSPKLGEDPAIVPTVFPSSVPPLLSSGGGMGTKAMSTTTAGSSKSPKGQMSRSRHERHAYVL